MGDLIEEAYHVDRYDRHTNDQEYIEQDVDVLFEKINELVAEVNKLKTQPNQEDK